MRDMCWSLVTTSGYVSPPHVDTEGTATPFRIHVGTKWWAILTPRIDTVSPASRLLEFDPYEEIDPSVWDVDVIVVRPGLQLCVFKPPSPVSLNPWF